MEAFITIRTDSRQEKTISLEELKTMLDMDGSIFDAKLSIRKDGLELSAHTDLWDTEYPTIEVNARDKERSRLDLGRFTLPNENFPESVTAFLDGGYEEELDEQPVAMMKHTFIPKDVRAARDKAYSKKGEWPRKIVHVTSYGSAKNWDNNWTKDLPEQEEI